MPVASRCVVCALLLGACAPPAAISAPASSPPAPVTAPASAAPAADAARADTDVPTVTFMTPGGAVSFTVELASTPRQRALGLRLRQSLADDQGMLYVFPREEEHPFFMKQMLFPLDIVFLDSAGLVVAILANVAPNNLAHLRAGVPSLRVVELLAGSAARHGITLGTRTTLNDLARQAAASD